MSIVKTPPDIWAWALPTLGTLLLAAVATIVSFFIRRWYLRRGKTIIYVGDRDPCQYITRGRWDSDSQTIIQSSPRFMEFRIHLTIENRRDTEITLRIKNVWFSDGYPEIRKDGWTLPGSCLSPTGLRIENAAAEITDPITIAARNMSHVRIIGTATSPVCHSGPFESWRYVFVDWISSPVNVPPFIQEVDQHGGGRSYDEDIEPTFPLPPHYPEMQRGFLNRASR
jgi:hypothetical protein